MYSFFGLQMENYQGDLTDIVRASGGQPIGCSAGSSDVPVSTWKFPSDPMNFFSSPGIDELRDNIFGDPFSTMRDPLLHDQLNMGVYYNSPSSADMISTNSVSLAHHQNIFEDDLKSPCNIFSRIQISPNNPPKLPLSPSDSPVIAAPSASPRGIKAIAMVPSDMINANSSKGCLVDNTGTVQISSPRNMGIKRRKSQAKKVVCIPAPAAANSRSTGEVVPSDLWAWRKYGQKPIKGSPYPRGYYRCSSSKGCSARKQVERSRTDPNMLVITYTSEHNHPWPTSRNALAGSTRSQPSKSNATSSKSTSPISQQQNYTTKSKEEESIGSTANASIKEEIEDLEKQLEIDDADQFSTEGFSQTYRPALPDQCLQSEDFFADLDEIDADPLNLLFSTQDFPGDDHQKEGKALDPFSLFDWSGDDKRGL